MGAPHLTPHFASEMWDGAKFSALHCALYLI
jgi:hypothetical protein